MYDMLRIIAGKYRSRLLKKPNSKTTRPTLDRVREALFNIIQSEINDAIVLDCFAGSGAFCLEALSRNAKKAIAIEKDKLAYQIIKQNAQGLNETNIEIKLMDSINYLKTEKELVFDFIYLDPPYKLDIIYQSLELILKNELLKNTGKIIIETNFEKQFEMPDGLEVFDQRIYGKTKLIFIKKI